MVATAALKVFLTSKFIVVFRLSALNFLIAPTVTGIAAI